VTKTVNEDIKIDMLAKHILQIFTIA